MCETRKVGKGYVCCVWACCSGAVFGEIAHSRFHLPGDEDTGKVCGPAQGPHADHLIGCRRSVASIGSMDPVSSPCSRRSSVQYVCLWCQ